MTAPPEGNSRRMPGELPVNINDFMGKYYTIFCIIQSENKLEPISKSIFPSPRGRGQGEGDVSGKIIC
jgi:hypothetical protein